MNFSVFCSSVDEGDFIYIWGSILSAGARVQELFGLQEFFCSFVFDDHLECSLLRSRLARELFGLQVSRAWFAGLESSEIYSTRGIDRFIVSSPSRCIRTATVCILSTKVDIFARVF